jgi:hypothetical protein
VSSPAPRAEPSRAEASLAPERRTTQLPSLAPDRERRLSKIV